MTYYVPFQDKIYYLVPINSPYVSINGLKLSSILSDNYPDVFVAANTKDAIFDEPKFDSKKLELIDAELERLYIKNYIPDHLIVVEEMGRFYEPFTNSEITYEELPQIELYEVPIDFVNSFMIRSNYPKRFSIYYEELIYSRCGEFKKDLENNLALKKENK